MPIITMDEACETYRVSRGTMSALLNECKAEHSRAASPCWRMTQRGPWRIDLDRFTDWLSRRR